jgi:hypothetical protein
MQAARDSFLPLHSGARSRLNRLPSSSSTGVRVTWRFRTRFEGQGSRSSLCRKPTVRRSTSRLVFIRKAGYIVK